MYRWRAFNTAATGKATHRRLELPNPEHFPNLPDMHRAVWRFVHAVPAGQVATYGQLARRLGDVNASRWVGSVLLHHAHQAACPCHRVVRSSGEVGRYAEGDDGRKARRLQAEGVTVHSGIVDLAGSQWDERRTGIDGIRRPLRDHRPLAKLAAYQRKIVGRRDLRTRGPIDQIAAVDVSYRGNLAYAAYVEYDVLSKSPKWSTILAERVRFPYITSYLAFREMPVLIKLLQMVADQRPLADVIVVDGSGCAHPRGAGIATMLGVCTNVCTIGVTKKRLFGCYDAQQLRRDRGGSVPLWNKASEDQRVVGYALLGATESERPLFVSPGHLIGAEQALDVVRRCCLTHRLPDPIYWADRISRQAARTHQSTVVTP